MSSPYSHSLQRAATAAQALLASLPSTIASRERERPGSGYAYATGALELSLFVLAAAANRVIADDKATDDARPSLPRLLAEASARFGPTDTETATERKAFELATNMVRGLDLVGLSALGDDGLHLGRLQVERQHIGMTIEELVESELHQHIATALVEQWQHTIAA